MENAHRFRTAFSLLLASAIGAAALLSVSPVLAQKTSWDRVAHIKKSATQLADLQKTRGALGAYEHIAACYKTHSLASSYGQAFEGCMILDYIHSKVTAAIHERIPAEERQKAGAPDPKSLVDAMSRRVGGGFAQYKISEKDAQGFIALVEKHGLPAFAAARFGKDGEPKAN
jgi:hypothetical protein